MKARFLPGDIVRVVGTRLAQDAEDLALVGREAVCGRYDRPSRDGAAWIIGAAVCVPDEGEPTGLGYRAWSFDERDLEFTGRVADDATPTPGWERGSEVGDCVHLELQVDLDEAGGAALMPRAVEVVEAVLGDVAVYGRHSWNGVGERHSIALDVYSLHQSALAMCAALLRRWPATFQQVHDDGWFTDLTFDRVSGEPPLPVGVLIDDAVHCGTISAWPYTRSTWRVAGESLSCRELRGCLDLVRDAVPRQPPEQVARVRLALRGDDGLRAATTEITRQLQKSLASVGPSVASEWRDDGPSPGLHIEVTSSSGYAAPELLVAGMAAWPTDWVDLCYDGRSASVSWQRTFSKWTEEYSVLLDPTVTSARLDTQP